MNLVQLCFDSTKWMHISKMRMYISYCFDKIKYRIFVILSSGAFLLFFLLIWHNFLYINESEVMKEWWLELPIS